jgi:hypothetical protein
MFAAFESRILCPRDRLPSIEIAGGDFEDFQGGTGHHERR